MTNDKHNNTINYYNNNAEAFIDRTFESDVSHLTDQFLSYIVDKGMILDLGCGSGRDSKYFMEKGYEVYAVDASKEMVAQTRQFLGDRVSLSTFQAYKTDNKYDGIWANASLLHVPEDEMVDVLSKFRDMLKVGGVFHMSFKERDQHFIKEDRSFTCYKEDSLFRLIETVGGFEVIQIYTTDDVRPDNVGERWVNGLIRSSNKRN